MNGHGRSTLKGVLDRARLLEVVGSVYRIPGAEFGDKMKHIIPQPCVSEEDLLVSHGCGQEFTNQLSELRHGQ